jgi:hypothetical protein
MTANETRLAEALLVSMFAGAASITNAQAQEAVSVAGATAIRFVEATGGNTVWHIADILNEDEDD